MPLMPNGTFQGIDELKGSLRFCENVAADMRRCGVHEEHMSEAAKDILQALDAEAAALRSIIAEYERKVSG